MKAPKEWYHIVRDRENAERKIKRAKFYLKHKKIIDKYLELS